jgi:hypothetical protein
MQHFYPQNATIVNDPRFNVDQMSRETSLARPLILTFAHLDPVALGVALGLVSVFWILFATVALLIRGGNVIGPNLALLSQYFIGYTVSWTGAIIGFSYTGIFGFLIGYSFASQFSNSSLLNFDPPPC